MSVSSVTPPRRARSRIADNQLQRSWQGPVPSPSELAGRRQSIKRFRFHGRLWFLSRHGGCFLFTCLGEQWGENDGENVVTVRFVQALVQSLPKGLMPRRADGTMANAVALGREVFLGQEVKNYIKSLDQQLPESYQLNGLLYAANSKQGEVTIDRPGQPP